MIDVNLKNYGATDFGTDTDSSAFNKQIGLFLVTEWGELPLKQFYGLNRDLMLNTEVDISLKEAHVFSQLNMFFSHNFYKPPEIRIKEDGRTLSIIVKYIDIFEKEVEQSVEI